MPGRRGMGGGSNFRNTAVQIDVSDARAFPTDVALQSDPPSEVCVCVCLSFGRGAESLTVEATGSPWLTALVPTRGR